MAVRKFGRNYQLTVQTDGLPLAPITLPYTIQFDITRNTLTSANVCQVRVYNLAKISRNQIRKNVTDFGNYKQIQLKAGYGDDIATIFQGNVSQAWSVREGVDFITQIECFDGGFAFINGVSNTSFPAGTPEQVVIRSLVNDLPNVGQGTVGTYDGVLTRGNSFSGNTADLLNEVTGGGFFVDNEVGHAIKENEFVPSVGGIVVINSESGLLGTPVLEQGIVRFEMLFEPKLVVGQQILLDGVTEGNFNGVYKVTSVKHRGMISESISGSVITTAEFIFLGV